MHNRVLFMIRGKLGDSLVAYAVARAYIDRHPDQEIHLLLRRDYAPLIAHERGFQLLPFGSRIEMILRLLWLRIRGVGFDAFVVLLGFGKPVRMAARIAGAGRNIYLDGRFADVFSEFPARWDPDTIEGPAWEAAHLLDSGISRPERLFVESLAARNTAAPGAPIAVVPIANELRKNLDRASLASLLEWLGRRHPDARLWIVLNPGDRGADAVFPDSLPANVEVKRFRTLLELISLLQQTSRYCGTDTGVFHVAAAMGIPATVFFGPTQPLKIVLPRQPGTEWLRLEVLRNDHCEVKSCTQPMCLHQAIANITAKPCASVLERTPQGCPLRAHAADSLARNSPAGSLVR